MPTFNLVPYPNKSLFITVLIGKHKHVGKKNQTNIFFPTHSSLCDVSICNAQLDYS